MLRLAARAVTLCRRPAHHLTANGRAQGGVDDDYEAWIHRCFSGCDRHDAHRMRGIAAEKGGRAYDVRIIDSHAHCYPREFVALNVRRCTSSTRERFVGTIYG
jgi:hypothetical protein